MIKQSVHAYGARLNIKNRGQVSDEMLNLQVYPHGEFPVVLAKDGDHYAQSMRYSLIPRWSKVEKPKFATYNARIETISEKPTWVKPLEENRCLVAFNGFFESCYGGTHDGHIVKFHKAEENELMVAAGIYDNWVNKETGEVIESFAIVTTKPSKFIESTGHDRSPLFLKEDSWEDWLESEDLNANQWKDFLVENSNVIEMEVETVRPLKKKKN